MSAGGQTGGPKEDSEKRLRRGSGIVRSFSTPQIPPRPRDELASSIAHARGSRGRELGAGPLRSQQGVAVPDVH